MPKRYNSNDIQTMNAAIKKIVTVNYRCLIICLSNYVHFDTKRGANEFRHYF